MAEEKKTTFEKVEEKIKYFKATDNGLIELPENNDYSIKNRRLTSAKTLQDYVNEAQKFRDSNPKAKVIESYSRNGVAVNLADLLKANNIHEILGLLSLEVKSCHEVRDYEISTGGIIEKETRIYNVELF